MYFKVVDTVPGSMQEFKSKKVILPLDNNVVMLIFARSVLIGLLNKFIPRVTLLISLLSSLLKASKPTSVIEHIFNVIYSRDILLNLILT